LIGEPTLADEILRERASGDVRDTALSQANALHAISRAALTLAAASGWRCQMLRLTEGKD